MNNPHLHIASSETAEFVFTLQAYLDAIDIERSFE